MSNETPTPEKILSPAAQRALSEAAERRRLADEKDKRDPRPREINGRKGTGKSTEPTRYGDWEIKGIIADF